MALRRDLTYPNRYEIASPSQPQGGFKNRTAPEVFDGSYLEEKWLNDWSGFFSKLLGDAGITPNNVVDSALSSQYMEALYTIIGGGPPPTVPAVTGNAVFNGDFFLTNPTLNGGANPDVGHQDYFADMWQFQYFEDGGTINSPIPMPVQDLPKGDAPYQFGGSKYVSYSSEIAVAGANAYIKQSGKIEGVNTLLNPSGNVTISFWAKGSVAGDVGVLIKRNYGNQVGASPTDYVLQNVVTLTTDWQYYSFTGSYPISALAVTTANDHAAIEFFVKNGAGNLAVNGLAEIDYNGTFSLANVQVVRGDEAGDFQVPPRALQRLFAFRYFQQVLLSYFDPIFVGRNPFVSSCKYSLPAPMREVSGFNDNFFSQTYALGVQGNIPLDNIERLTAQGNIPTNCFIDAVFPDFGNAPGSSAIPIGYTFSLIAINTTGGKYYAFNLDSGTAGNNTYFTFDMSYYTNE
jgi:hypothetical protein